MVKFKEYFKAQLKSFGYKEWKDGFNRDNIPSTELDNAYFMSYSISAIDSGIVSEDSIAVTLELFSKGFRDPQTAIDTAMEKANELRLSLCSFTKIAEFADVNLLGVVFVSQVPEQLSSSNDNSIKVELQFNVRLKQIIC